MYQEVHVKGQQTNRRTGCSNFCSWNYVGNQNILAGILQLEVPTEFESIPHGRPGMHEFLQIPNPGVSTQV